jgi:hypothetical protein
MKVSGAATAGYASSVVHDLEDVMHNPFADLQSSSSFSPSLRTPTKRGLHRRKISEQAPSDTHVHTPGWTFHTRSRSPLEASGHPLRSDIGESTCVFVNDDSGITRPRLHRLVNMGPEQMDTRPSVDLCEVTSQDNDDRLVLIHEVLFSYLVRSAE